MKKLFLTLVVVLTTTICAQAQIQVNAAGQVFIPNRLFITGNGNTLHFFANNPGTEIGSSTDKVDFWYSGLDFNKVVAEKFSTISDMRLKTNILTGDGKTSDAKQMILTK